MVAKKGNGDASRDPGERRARGSSPCAVSAFSRRIARAWAHGWTHASWPLVPTACAGIAIPRRKDASPLALRLPCLVSCHRAGLAKSTRLAFVVCKYVSEVCSLQVPLRSTKSFGRWPGSGLQHTGGGLFAESAAGLAPGSWRGRARASVSRFGSEVRLYEPCVCVCPAPGAYPGLGPLAVGRCF